MSKLNTDTGRAAMGLFVTQALNMLAILHAFHIDAAQLGAINATAGTAVTLLFLFTSATPSNPPSQDPLPPNAPLTGGGVPAQVDRGEK